MCLLRVQSQCRWESELEEGQASAPSSTLRRLTLRRLTLRRFSWGSEHNAESAQRTAVKLRPHPESTSCPVATSEPVVLHHGREEGRYKVTTRYGRLLQQLWAAISHHSTAASHCFAMVSTNA